MSKCIGVLVVALAVAGLLPARAHAQVPSQVTRAELTSMIAEVRALDPATRRITLAGPLGGELSGVVTAEVKNLDQVKVGDLVEISYEQSIAVSAHKKGEANPLFTGGGVATAVPGSKPEMVTAQQTMETVTVVSVDTKSRTLVVQTASGALVTRSVLRPEFVEKLKTLHPGDQLDVVVTEAAVVKVVPATPGSQTGIAYTAGTLIIDRGEIVQRTGQTLLIRNERGRMVRVVVDPDVKFMVEGKEVSVYELKPGLHLTRTVMRVTNAEYVAGQ